MSKPPGPNVLLVGHCIPDAYLLKSAVERLFPDAAVSMIGTSDKLDAALATADLVLVNRVLDGYFRAAGGIPLIRELASRTPAPGASAAAVMLVSDMDDAQQEAENAGAFPGIGKSDLYSDEVKARLEAALASRSN